MRIFKVVLFLFILLILTSTAIYAQQTFTQTVTSANRNCNAVCSVIDISALNNNPAAVIFITPGAANYQHPIGAYYMYLNKWSVFNLDGTAIPVGATFNVEYYVNPDANHFVYVAPPLAHSNDVRFLDHAGLNNNPNAQVRVFPTNSPPSGVSGANFNSTEVRVDYDLTTSKWFIYNFGNTTVPTGTAYSVKISTGGPVVINPNVDKTPKPPFPTSACNCVIPTSLPPEGSAGGDLGGTYPYPKVTGLQGKPLSNDPPAVGQVLKWNGSAWEPANVSATGNTYNAGTGLAIQGTTIYANNIAPMWNANKLSGNAVSTTTPTIGQVLKWNGTAWEPAADNGGTAATTPTPKSYTKFFSGGDYKWFGNTGYEFALPGMSIQITIATPSMVNVSVFVQTTVTKECGIASNCGSSGTGINLYRDNTLLVKTMNGGTNTSVAQVLPNYPELLNPGTYTYKVYGRRIYLADTVFYLGGSNPDESFKSYMSIQVFPQ